MPDLFYIAIDGQQQGPFTIDELATKPVFKDTMVWTAGLDNWIKAEHMPLLKDVIRVTPPPLREEPQKVYMNTKREPVQTPYFGYQLASKSQRLMGFIITLVLLVLPYQYLAMRFLDDSIRDNDWNYVYENVGSVFVSALLGALFYRIWGGNLGHKILGLKVISSEDGSDKKASMDGAVREGVKAAMSFFILPVLWILLDDDNQNLYDKVTNTYVVKKTAQPSLRSF